MVQVKVVIEDVIVVSWAGRNRGGKVGGEKGVAKGGGEVASGGEWEEGCER